MNVGAQCVYCWGNDTFDVESSRTPFLRPRAPFLHTTAPRASRLPPPPPTTTTATTTTHTHPHARTNARLLVLLQLSVLLCDCVFRSVSNVAYVPFIRSGCLNASAAQAMLDAPTAANNGLYYRWACGEGSHLLNATSLRSATTVFSPTFNPFSSESIDFVQAVRAAMDNVTDAFPGVDLQLCVRLCCA
jgi:hypothetical protein